jgi:hypothetical protein
MGRIYSTSNVRAFHATATIRCGEPKHADSRFITTHTSGFILFVSHAKQIIRFFFHYIYFLKLLFYMNMFN